MQQTYYTQLIDSEAVTETSREYLVSPSEYINKGLSPRPKLAVMASGRGTNFNALYHAISSKKLEADLSLLITNNVDSGAHQKAIENNVQCEVIDHRHFQTRNEHDECIIQCLRSHRIQLVVMAGWMRIVTPYFVHEFRNKIINIHPSLLPSFRGVNAIQQSLNAKVKITGCTVHYVTEEVDSGEIIIQSAVPIYDSDNIDELTNRIQTQEHIILPIGVSIACSQLSC